MLELIIMADKNLSTNKDAIELKPSPTEDFNPLEDEQ